MRVAFDVTVPARSATGVGVYARELLPRLQARSGEIVVWQAELGPPAGGLARLGNAVRLTIWLLRVARRSRQERLAVYHSASSVGPLTAPCPRVMTVHDAALLSTPTQYGAADRLYHRVFSVLAARRATAVIVPSRAAGDEVARAYRVPAHRLHVTPYGVAPRFRPVPPATRGVVLRRYGVVEPYVLFVGAQPPRKNLARLVTAYGEVARRGKPLSLVLAGPPEPEDGGVRKLVARLALEGRVRRIPWVADDDLPALYSGAVCLAYPSLSEGFGLPILEAMACGTPVLTSARSSMVEIAGGAAVLVDPLSVGAIAEGLGRLVEGRELRAERAAAGRRRAATFSWERTAELTQRVYRLAAASEQLSGAVARSHDVAEDLAGSLPEAAPQHER